MIGKGEVSRGTTLLPLRANNFFAVGLARPLTGPPSRFNRALLPGGFSLSAVRRIRILFPFNAFI
ncbi:hypothetical protein A3C21_00505 [Candidatus Kaiserbacteria bacterium RIFCSPHIGHO2_02_FULL_59_21]|uniref:Uncharacterized protein n=1 Tax=Candidatus Kaiserbacteria bacterium RIFCSPHIGHO2_02_FULL_59_21 TaxID=1798500 RepID=A0A1F6E0Q4_9BACT|nr:MAG: hypothetical protein A2766_01200 [Candidatus Kaiserbacteria bacterium RIFCSPHIGHO2_01_FULL_58_22]OGG67275.1 MAG: hypothetical protein A3C21_00505 [Candidatus Kaiserbacteria bacterium RIFCSPHIGHO2_02_FULL_59_21]OGG79532.1 MAG: hypothetical protein A2952_03200 [Candidatus Kaiserbacteria bacterium RIFCSPLOWO2_01_FULL_59_34]OGG86301.1 MAG: hypothetical protein A3I47_01400 [Candidatus Kaiserbacteria bacterium RIFCSPLOWO2_02_FULL_59_19]